jgi:hypothetical protein
MVLISLFLRQVGWAQKAPDPNPLRSNIRDIAMIEAHIGGGEGPARTERKFRPWKHWDLEDHIQPFTALAGEELLTGSGLGKPRATAIRPTLLRRGQTR